MTHLFPITKYLGLLATGVIGFLCLFTPLFAVILKQLTNGSVGKIFFYSYFKISNALGQANAIDYDT